MSAARSDLPASTVSVVARLLAERVAAHHGDAVRAESLRVALQPFATDPAPVTPAGLAAVEGAAQRVFRHVRLDLAVGLEPQETSPGWPAPDVDAVRRAGARVGPVVRHPDGVAVLSLDGLAPAHVAAPFLAAAFAQCAGARLLVLDLRRNGGGDPATVAAVVDWVAGDGPRHLFDVRRRDRTRQWWTAGAPLAAPVGVPVVAVVGPSTYSSGEALAWSLQDQGLARLVGAATPGAADHVVPLALTHDVSALVPEATVLAPDGGPTWEGTGVRPDHAWSLDDTEPLDPVLLERVTAR